MTAGFEPTSKCFFHTQNLHRSMTGFTRGKVVLLFLTGISLRFPFLLDPSPTVTAVR